MKLAKSLSLGVALALGASGLALTAPAMAKKEKPAAGPNVQLSKEYRAAVVPIDADIRAGKFDGIFPRLDTLAQFQAPDERYTTAALRYSAAKAGNNTAEIRKAIAGMIDSGSTTISNAVQLNTAAGQMAFNAKDYAEAATRLAEAIRLGDKEGDTRIILAESNFQTGKFNEGLAWAEQAVAAKQAAGQKPPEDWYKRALSIAYKNKLSGQIGKWSRAQLLAYPSAENWRTSLVLFRDSGKLEAGPTLDLYRLMRLTKSLAGERDFYEYGQTASDRGLPGETKSVLEEGMATGAIGKATRPINELLGVANTKVSGDLASLAASERQAGSAASGKVAMSTADAYLGYGQDAKAAALYRIALQKGQIDTDAANTRLGIALARQGMKAEAKQAFGLVTGARSEIAKFWVTWLDLKV